MNLFTLSRRHQPGTKRLAQARPVLELLEERTVLSTLTVLNALDSGAGSLRDTIKAASSGDQVVFAPSLSGQTITLTSGELAITKSLDFEGLGWDKLAISGDNQSRVFDISQNQEPVAVTIAGLTVKDGQFSGIGGGGILNVSSTLNLRNDVMSNNVALGKSLSATTGGAIYNSNGGTLTVTGCTFTGNQALGSNGGSDGEGGAIISFKATATITGSTFTNNLCHGGEGGNGTTIFGWGRGGAIYNYGQMTIDNCTFDGNQAIGGNNAAPSTKPGQSVAVGFGGAIYYNGGAGTLTVRNTTITNNHATGGTTTSGRAGPGVGGGLMIVESASLIMDNCTVSDNSATGGPGGGAGSGGGLYLGFGSTASVTNSTFSDNQAIGGTGKAGVPGGLATGGGITVGVRGGDNCTLSLGNCTITGNLAQGGDGGDGLDGGNGWGGGVAVFSGSSAALDTCTVTSNSAIGGKDSAGGSDGNGYGGGLYIDVGATVMVKKTTIKRNTASTAGNNVYGTLS
jgi:hypothetical protein